MNTYRVLVPITLAVGGAGCLLLTHALPPVRAQAPAKASPLRPQTSPQDLQATLDRMQGQINALQAQVRRLQAQVSSVPPRFLPGPASPDPFADPQGRRYNAPPARPRPYTNIPDAQIIPLGQTGR